MNSSHDDEADLRDREFPDETDLDDASETSIDLETCPYCGKAVHAQADLCPHCRSFISFEAPAARPLWIIVTALIGILLVLTWALLRWGPGYGVGGAGVWGKDVRENAVVRANRAGLSRVQITSAAC